MKFCQPHWDALRAAIDVRGLSHLVGKSGEVAAERLAREASGAATPSDFDPLMGAHNAITAQFLKDVGLEGLSQGCPVCSVGKYSTDCVMNWINGASDDALRIARELKLVPEAS